MAKLRLLCIFLGLTLTVAASPATAGHLSDLEFLSLTPVGAQWEVRMRLSVGAGQSGFERGADLETTSIGIAAYGSSDIEIFDFTPAMITGSFTNGTYVGVNIGADGSFSLLAGEPFFGPQSASTATLLFYDESEMEPPLACVISTAACGNIHQEIFEIMIRYSEIPIGIRMLGVEGAGNFFGGVYPYPDMAIDFSTIVAVPEPEAYAMLLAGLGLLGFAARPRKPKAATTA